MLSYFFTFTETITSKQASFILEENIKQDNIEIIKTFFKKYSTLNIKTDCGDSLLYLSCKYNSVKIFSFLIQQKVDVNCVNFSDELPIHMACRSGNLEMVKTLYESGKFDSHNKQTNIGMTAFMIACECGFADIAEYLYDKGGVNINHKENVFKYTAVQLAVINNRKDVIQFFKRRIF